MNDRLPLFSFQARIALLGGFLSAVSSARQAVPGCQAVWAPAFGCQPTLDNDVYALAVFDDNGGPALYVGGAFDTAGNVLSPAIAKWDGLSWTGLGSGLDTSATVYALAVFDDGNGSALYVGGSFQQAGGSVVRNIARWNGSAWSALASGLTGNSVRALAVYDDGTGPALYAGGDIDHAGGTPVNGIAKWNGSSWSPLANGVGTGQVRALTVFDDGTGDELYVTGTFHSQNGGPGNRIAKWNGSAWSVLGDGVSLNASGFALAAFFDGSGPLLFVGGSFSSAGGVSVNKVATWNGSAWSTPGTGFEPSGNSQVNALSVFDDGSGPALYAGGYFFTAGGAPCSCIAKWDGASWSGLGNPLNLFALDGPVSALAGFDDGNGPALYAGGAFLHSGPCASSFIAQWICKYTNSGTSYCTAGTTSNSCVPTVSGTGVASATANSGFTISVANVEGDKAGLLFYGLCGPAAVPWGVGSTSLRCVRTPTQRMNAQTTGGVHGSCQGILSDDWNAFIDAHPAALGQPFIGGETVWAQGWFRDPPTTKTTGLSDGLVFAVAP